MPRISGQQPVGLVDGVRAGFQRDEFGFQKRHRKDNFLTSMSGASCAITLPQTSERCQVNGYDHSLRCGTECLNRRHVVQNTVISVAVLAVFIGMTPLRAQPKGESVTIKGEVVDMWRYLEGGDRGPSKKDCATACAKAGNPILVGKMNEQVTGTGTLVKKAGV